MFLEKKMDHINEFNNDSKLLEIIDKEKQRQQNCIELIASENIASPMVMAVQGSVFTNKYAEGYPGRRYYGGCVHADELENLAIERVKKLYGCPYANVQPHSGSQANQAVFMALLQPGDSILGMRLDAGGHLTHGAAPNQSGKWFRAYGYGVDPETHLIDYDRLEQQAKEVKPKLIIAGGSAYPRVIDFARFRAIADLVGAYLLVDMAHYSGLIAGGVYPTPIPFADVVTSTTHKTLRCARGGIILTNNPDLAKKINSAIFPGLQGGPLMNVIAGKAAGFYEALQPEFKAYAMQVIKNAKVMGEVLTKHGLKLITGGTDCHMVIVDLTPFGVSGKAAEEVLERVGITCNKNAIPADTQPPRITSGIRVGSAAGTTRGFKEKEFEIIAELIVHTLEAYKRGDDVQLTALQQKVKQLCERFPLAL